MKIALFLFLFSFPSLVWAGNSWEVGVLFLGAAEQEEYQLDIDENIKELARLKPGQRLGIMREFPERVVEYFPDSKSSIHNAWDPLFQKPPASGITIPGIMRVSPHMGKSFLDNPSLSQFFRDLFQDPSKKRLLIIYGHGEGYEGLRAKPVLELQSLLEKVIPRRPDYPLDLLWFNSCFMANIESAFQWRKLAPILMASEDAEFSAGAPYDSLDFIQDKDPKTAALDLAERYVESYSFTKKGSQRRVVEESSATITVMDTKKLSGLVSLLKNMGDKLKKYMPSKRSEWKKAFAPFQMERKDLVDIGQVGSYLKEGELISFLELNRRERKRSSPRLLLRLPAPGAKLLFGYDDWTRGFEGDKDILDRMPIKPEGFLAGPNAKKWPINSIVRGSFVSPFTVGMDVFDYYFIDGSGKPLTRPESFTRHTDFFTYEAKTSRNPLLFIGYTQGVGDRAKIYTGLNISDPTLGVPTLEYPNLDFFKETGWGNY